MKKNAKTLIGYRQTEGDIQGSDISNDLISS